jgi:hypothetical protein
MRKGAILLLSSLFGAALLHAAVLPESQKIDAILVKEWAKNNLKPNPPATDEVLVRRLYLDIAGRIPTLEESQAFLQSADPAKRQKLIDRLLGSDGYTSNMFNYWADLLRLTDEVNGKVAAQAYAQYVKHCLKENKTYDQFVDELLSAEGGVWDNGAIGFYTRDENKLDQLAYAVQVFLGTSIVCAECHNHPFDKWTQMDFYGLAAFTYGMGGTGRKSSADPFGLGMGKGGGKGGLLDKGQISKLSKEDRAKYYEEHAAEIAKQQQDWDLLQKVLSALGRNLTFTTINMTDGLPKLPPDYKYKDGEPGQTIEPKALFGHIDVPEGGEPRLKAFAKWMTSPENPRFTVVIANRMWKKVFGQGLIEPVDEMTDSTVPSNGELMDYLTQVMIEKRYSLKSFLRVLYNTDTYQRMASPNEMAPGEIYHFTGPLLRRMSAEQVWDSLVTLAHGDLDQATSEEYAHVQQYLANLKMLVDGVHAKGVDGMLEIARRTVDGEGAMEKKGAPPDKNAKEAFNPKKKTDVNALLVAVLGEERARELQESSNMKKPGQGKGQPVPVLDKAALNNLSKEERKAAMEMAANVNPSCRASELPSPERAGHLLRTFGQSDREQISNANEESTVTQALAMLNSPLSSVLGSPLSKLQQDLAKAHSLPDKIDLLYMSFLSRHPTRAERAMLDQVIRDRQDTAPTDVTHALLMSGQFIFVE